MGRTSLGEGRPAQAVVRGAARHGARRAHGAIQVLIGLCAILFGGCGKDNGRPDRASTDVVPSGDGADYGPVLAQACTPEGSTKECGRVYHTDGDYVYCSVGHATCTDGAWSACTGDHFVVKSAPSLRMSNAGLHFLAVDNVCTNACDPYCLQIEQEPKTVAAAGIVQADAGGVTLEWKEITAADNTACVGLQCALVICGSTATTTISGTVYDPAGKNPLYNAEVYIPLHPSDPLPAFNSGASCDTCGGAQALDAIRATQTDANGKFVLSDVPVGQNIPIVVQMGKWRRELVLSNVQACVDNRVAANCTAASSKDCTFRLPKNQKDGFDPALGTYTKADMPQTAIITGSADPFDCLLMKAGIDPTEVGDQNSSKRIHFYQSDSSAGNTLNPAYGSKVLGSVLWNDLKGQAPNMMSYDVILLPCEGGAYDKQGATSSNTPYKNLVDYANAGGRAFATHYTYSWLAFPPVYVAPPDNWATVAAWTPAKVTFNAAKLIWSGTSINTQDPLTGTVNTVFPKGAVFSQWLSNVKAANRPRRLRIHEGRQDLSAVGSGAQSWMTAKDLGAAGSPSYPNLFTFNTPYGADASKQCGRMVYSDFHVSSGARTSCDSKGVCQDACLTDTDCGFTATCVGEISGAVGQCNEPCASTEDCPNDSYACNGAVLGKCEQTQCTSASVCGVGRYCKSGGCTCSDSNDCNGGVCTNKTCQPIACHADLACGRGTCGRGTGATAGTCKAGFVCHTDAQCGPGGTCGTGTGATKGTCSRINTYVCHKDNECDSGACGTGTGATKGTCGRTTNYVCHKDSECDSGSCGLGTGAVKGACARTTGYACHTNAECDSGSCGTGTGATAGACTRSNAFVCHANSECDSGSCGTGTGATAGVCTRTNAFVCHANSECDSGSCGTGTGATAGTCNTGPTTTCHTNSDCDSLACGTVTAGTCSTSAATCHTNAECDSGSCGAGTGSTAGTCNTGPATVCHTNAQCDSNACGTVTKGVCGLLGNILCHANSDCESGTCGTGTLATKGVCQILAGAACHKNADCDSNLCGSGTGAVAGKCVNSAANACHTNAQCDSGACGTGTGAVKGLCTTNGSCTSNAQCGSGTCNLVTKVCVNTLYACSLDSQCGTGGVCTGATCATKACAADSACTLAGSTCSGATCSAPAACSADANCVKSGQCIGATCGAPAQCSLDANCLVSHNCIGALCTSQACTTDSTCTASNQCNGAKCSTKTCATDSACGVTGSACNGAKCSAAPTCANDAACTASHLCNNAKCSTPAACGADSACLASRLCVGAKCSTATCATDSACLSTNLCVGAKCSTAATCATDAACPSSNSCVGSKCSTAATCAGDVGCPSSNLCTGSKCSTPAACAGDAACPGSGLCNSAKCSGTATCAVDTDCPSLLCNNATCNASDCDSALDCGTGSLCGGSCTTKTCTSNADCPSGLCSEGICVCAAREDCGGSQQCSDGTLGACGRSCTSDDQCAPDRCVNGLCGGCTSAAECHDSAYTASCQGIPAGNYGKCSAASGGQFPESCKQGDLLPQEKALEFMFFDLTACVSPDNLPPPKPVTNASFTPATFVQDFTATCPPETQPVWRDFDYQAEVPAGTSIDFAAQSGDTLATLLPVVPVAIGQATATTNVGPNKSNYDAALLDTGIGGNGAFSTASPAVLSKSLLRITIALNPTTDKQKAPRLAHWKVQYDCQQAN